MNQFHQRFSRTFLQGLLLIVSLLSIPTVFAHGYLVNSRAHLCAQGTNTNCGAIIWEPQSVEGTDRYPETGPLDGVIASGGNSSWSPLNEQNLGRWSKNLLKSGAYTFQWQFTAPHSARDIRYWITKADWNPNMPLSRSQFESQPFCKFDYNGKPPVPDISVRASHACTIPARTGYHLILSVWDVSDTTNSFYSVMDANFDSVPPPNLTQVGSIVGSTDLPINATAATRVFNSTGEVTSLGTVVTITNVADGLSNKWPRLLATAVNAKGNGVQAGALSGGIVTPADGTNNIY
ncbi:MAG: lytic polysaccharide monooxygenase, partial [Undibacterium sp.]|nr:lytic polysaccharide monooxygenase [Undibacterium sp.]